MKIRISISTEEQTKSEMENSSEESKELDVNDEEVTDAGWRDAKSREPKGCS